MLHPLTILKDVPSTFGSYAPENFDLRFMGPLPATQALNYSRNIPAVDIAAKLSKPNLYQFLRLAGSPGWRGKALRTVAGPGGGEVTAQELAKLYAILANRGVLRPLRMTESEQPAAPVRLLSEEAAFITWICWGSTVVPVTPSRKTDDTAGVLENRHVPGFRDARSSGITGPYVLVVWLGNFDGTGNSALIGAEAAAPLFFNIIDNIMAEYPALREPDFPLPENLRQVEVCLASGNLPTQWCQRRGKTGLSGKSPIAVDTIYRPVATDKITGDVVCPPYDPAQVNIDIYEYWPSDWHGYLPRRSAEENPPSVAHCKGGNSLIGGTPPQITSPLRNTTYTLRRTAKQPSSCFTATADNDSSVIYWFAGDAYLGNSTSRRPLEWKPEAAGRYRIRAVDDHGRADSRMIQVDILG